MLAPLRWQILWAPALCLITTTGLLGWEVWQRTIIVQHVTALTDLREALDRDLLRVTERHGRTMRRVREALLEPRENHRDAMLAWSADHYQQEMSRLLSGSRGALRAQTDAASVASSLQLDLARLDRQMERIDATIPPVASALGELLAASASGDAELLSAALQEVERRDREMSSLLRTAGAMLRRAAVSQARQVGRRSPLLHPSTWAVIVGLAVATVFIARRRIHRLALLLTRPDAPPPPRSPEERTLVQHLDRQRSELEGLLQRQAAHARDTERASQTHRRLEQELALLRLYNDNLVNSLRSAVLVADSSGQLIAFNRSARHLFALDEHRVGTSMQDLPLHVALLAQQPDVSSELRSARDERAVLRFDAVALDRHDGQKLFDIAVVPYLDESGAARGQLWVVDDVTEAVRTKSQLLAAERLAAVGRLSAQVAHEIRNPLSAIALNTELLSDELERHLPPKDGDEAQALIKAIANEIERLTEVTEGYLHLARLPSPNMQSVDLNQLVSDLMAMLREEFRAHRVEVVLDLARPAPHAWGDPGQLRQALMNIVRNSREALGDDGGRVLVRTSGGDEAAVIQVHDSGPGIAAELAQRIFEPFFSTKASGTGLGLSVTQQILREHGGQIVAESPTNGGALIRITLPTHDRDDKGL